MSSTKPPSSNLRITKQDADKATKIVIRRLMNQPIPVLIWVTASLLKTLEESYPGYDVVAELRKLSDQYAVRVDTSSLGRKS